MAWSVLGAVSVASAAGADSVTSMSFSTSASGGSTDGSYFGAGALGTVEVVGTFAGDGGTASITTNAPGVTFSGEVDSNGSDVTGDFASTSATPPGAYSVTVTDDDGSATLPDAFTVDPTPVVNEVNPASLSVGNSPTSITVTGTGFTTVGGLGVPKVKLTSTVNGTTLTVAAPVTSTTGTTITVLVTPTNSVTGNPATAGSYDVTVVNADGGAVTSGPLFSVTAYGIEDVSPSALPTNTSTSAALLSTVTISGVGFEVGATVTLSGTVCTGVGTGDDDITLVSATVTSATSITALLSEPVGASNAAECDFTVDNDQSGGNGATSTVNGALGIGEASVVAPTIVSSSATTPLVVGAAPTTVTFTGSGFSEFDTAAFAFPGTSPQASTLVTLQDAVGNSGISIAFTVTAADGSGAAYPQSGPYGVSIEGSNTLAAGLTVAGPAISSQTPSGIAVEAVYGTVIDLSGTGFTDTTSGDVTPGATGLGGVVSYTSSTSMTLVVTTSPVASSVADPATVTLTQAVSSGVFVDSPPFALSVDAPPDVTGAVTYATAPVNDVGAGATSEEVFIHGTGFAPGVKVGDFVSGSGTPDPDVSATVESVNEAGTQIAADIAIVAGDTNFADGYTVTNTDGGIDAVPASSFPLVIGPGPTISDVLPAPVMPSSTNAITITGTNFEAGAKVTPTFNGTCGIATVTSSSTLSVSCTFGAASPTKTSSLVVTNPDGGSAVSAAVLPVSPSTVRPRFYISRVAGTAVAGRWATLTIVGSGFTGRPTIVSSAHGSRIAVVTTTLSRITIRIWTEPDVSGVRTLTIELSNGLTARKNYLVGT